MDNTYQLEVDNLPVGLTKPPTQLGVPLMAFYSNMVVCFLVWTLTQNVFQQKFGITLFFLVLFGIVHLFMAWVTFRDPFGLSIFWMNVTSFRKHITHQFWNNADSYSP